MRSDELARLERLADVVVGADLEPLDAAFGLAARGQHQDRHARGRAQRAGELETGLARHHHVEDQEVEAQAFELGARLGRRLGGGDPIAFGQQEARKEVADAAVVVDHQHVRRIVGKLGGGGRHGAHGDLSAGAGAASGPRAQ